MTPDQQKTLALIFDCCAAYDCGKHDNERIELYKKQITELNLTPDEYEYAVAKVAAIVGV